jgi:hypothetical protein
MIYLKYKDVQVTFDTYVLEFINKDQKEDMIVSRGLYSYARLLIFALDKKINGYIIYPITRSRVKIVEGLPINRGRKKTKQGEIKLSFVDEIPEPPATMQ